jgi:hypothetical protein
MTRTRHDLFAKQYFTALLKPFGTVKPNYKLISETREVDLLFIPHPTTAAERKALGLVGRMLKHRYLFETFRNPVNLDEIESCMGKLNSDREALLREAKRQKRRLRESEKPRLAIVSPTISERILRTFNAVPTRLWGKGVYQMEDLNILLIAVHQLPVNRDTVWLRLVGRNGVQQGAIAELLAMPEEHPLRQQVVDNLSILRIGLEQDDNLGKDERGIMTNLEAVYEEWREKTLTIGRQEGEQRGRQEGRQEIVLRLLSRRVGVLSAKVRSQITCLSAEQLEALAEALLDFSSTKDLVAWLRNV